MSFKYVHSSSVSVMPLAVPKVAFVAGCNGISGNAIVEYLIRQPKEEWYEITHSRNLTISDTGYRSSIVVSSRSPTKSFWQDPRVEFVAIDFLAPLETIIQQMLPMCKEVTHAYFTSYIHTDDFKKLRDMNIPLFENYLTAIDTVAGASLQRVCLQTGGKVQSPVDYYHHCPSHHADNIMPTELWLSFGPH